jgi:predicted acylesterase/phospholipase RssA
MATRVVVSAGGARSWIGYGSLVCLKEKGHLERVTEYVTTSGGSIATGMFLAGIHIDDLQKMCQSLHDAEVMDIDLSNFMKRFGIVKGNVVFSIIEKILRKKTGLPEAFTFRQFREFTGKLFVVCSFCVDDAEMRFFDAERTPDMSVVDAMRMSCSIPFFFQACEYENKWFVDGAVCEYTQLSHIPKGERETTLVIKTGGNERMPGRPTNFLEFASAIYNAMHPCYRDTVLSHFPNRFELRDTVNGEKPMNPIRGIRDIDLVREYYHSGVTQTNALLAAKPR